MNRTSIDETETDKTYKVLLDLYNLLGENAVLLPVPLGAKNPIYKSWQKTKFKDTLEPSYWCNLVECAEQGGNIGVLLTDGLTTIDCDSDEFAEEMIHLNPALENTLRSTGARGCQFWLRQHDEDYYQGVKNLKTIDGVKIGEWRGGASKCQSIIFGQHPNHTEEKPVLYRTNGKKVSTSLQFKDIVWTDNVKHCWVEIRQSKSTQSTITDTGLSSSPSAAATKSNDVISESVTRRIVAYMLKVPASIEGQGGDDQLFKASCILVQGFGLTPSQALPFLKVYDERSEPAWALDRLIYKLDEADKKAPESDKPRGHLLKSDQGDRDEVRGKFIKALESGVDTDALEENTVGLKPADLDMVCAVLAAADLSTIKRNQVCQILGGKGKPLKVSFDDLLDACAPKEKKTVDEWEIEPWSNSVDGALLLDELTALIRRHIALQEHEAQAIALWVVLTHCEPYVDFAPILRIGSPQKRCGKSTLLELLEELVRRPLMTVGVTSAALFRTIEKDLPTILMDEVETFIKGNEEMRGIIDSGYKRKGFVLRCNPVTNNPERFRVWSFKAIAGLGRLHDTIEDRAIPINLQRRNRSTKIVLLRDRDQDQITRLKRQIHRWALDNGEAIKSHRPPIPVVLNDREGQLWTPMFCVADTAGGHWSARARSFSQTLSGSEVDDENFSIILLLGLRQILSDPDHAHQDFFSSAGLVLRLNRDDEAPWANWSKGDVKGLTVEKLASTLKPYGLKSKQSTERVDRSRGYDRSALEAVFEQYLENRGVSPENDTQPVHTTRQSPTRADSHVNGLKKQPVHEGGCAQDEKTTCARVDPLPERIPEERAQDDTVFTPRPVPFSDFDQNGTSSTQTGEMNNYSKSKVLESGLTVAQTKMVRNWLKDWKHTLDTERRLAEVEAQKEKTRRYLEQEFFPAHPVTRHPKTWENDRQYDIEGAKRLIGRLQVERDQKNGGGF